MALSGRKRGRNGWKWQRTRDDPNRGRRFLATIEAAIREREAELESLRENAAKWLALNG
jgi:hypothetical protein